MKSLGKNSKRVLLERVVEREIKEESESFFIPPYPACKLFANIGSIRKKFSEKVNNPPACLSDSGIFCLELNQDRKEAAKDRLDIGEQLSCYALDNIGLPYSIPESDMLENSGMHITTNPGFGYSEQQ